MAGDISKNIKIGQTIYIIEPYKTHNTGWVNDRIPSEVMEIKGSLLTIRNKWNGEIHYIKAEDERIRLL